MEISADKWVRKLQAACHCCPVKVFFEAQKKRPFSLSSVFLGLLSKKITDE